MSKVILVIDKGSGQRKLEYMKCNDAKRASELAEKRPNCIGFDFFPSGTKVPRTKRKEKHDDYIYAKIQRGEINMDNIEQFLR